MIRAIHIEDEPRNIELLKNLLDKFCTGRVAMLGGAKSIEDGLKLIELTNPQLVFLDIELNGGSAFDLLAALPEPSFRIIFITAYNQYAVQAFRVNAVDYLLKPISTIALVECVDKAEHQIRLSSPDIENVPDLPFNDKIGFPVTEGKIFVDINDIVKLEAKGSYTHVTLVDARVIVATKNLKSLSELLPVLKFQRLHHSWIINVDFLQHYYPGKQSFVEMSDGSRVPVSIRKKGKFLDQFA